jgi:uncharacterized MAPEG superfamily protein
MRKLAIRTLVSALVGALLVAGVVTLAGRAQQAGSNGADIFTQSLFPFYAIAAFLTHNAEDTSAALIYSVMFLFFAALVYALLFMCSKIWSNTQSNRDV